MKNIKSNWIWICAAMLTITSCSRAQTATPEKTDLLANKKVLIVYLSRTNNTKALAEIIHSKVGGDLMPLELITPYPAHYQTTVDQVARENASGFLPPLKTVIDSIEKYDAVFVGFPTWGMQLPPPVKSFLNQYSLAGRTVIPFNSNGGYGIGSTFETVRKLCPQGTVMEGFSTKGGSERDGKLFVIEGNTKKQVNAEIEDWLKKLGMLPQR